MNTDNYIIALFIFIDDLVKKLKKIDNFQIPRISKAKCGRKRKLCLSEIITLGIFRFSLGFSNWKDYHKFLQKAYKNYFPSLPNYENFMKCMNTSLGLVMMIIILLLNDAKEGNTLQYVDSTDLPVCSNRRINSHKVCRGIAKRGKTSKGWFYGFKLHGVCNEDGYLLSLIITEGNVDDRKYLKELLHGLKGIVVGDAGYLSKDLLEDFLDKEILLITGVRKNMKRLMTKEQEDLLKSRQRIEVVWSVLKTRMGIVTHLARSVTGLFRHYSYCILAYIMKKTLIHDKKLICCE